MKLILIDIDNTLLDFDAYIRQTMEEGFAHFGLRPYEPWMYDVFHRENNKLWRQIEEGTLTFQELEKIRAVENFDPDTVTCEQGDKKKAVLLTVNGLNVINAMAQLYMSVIIQ